MPHRSTLRPTGATILTVFCFLLTARTPLFGSSAEARTFGTRAANMWTTQEFSLTNRTWSGNPFDLVATVTFSHAQEVRTTEMFYVGNDMWKFRFTGTRGGIWHFSTSSSDTDLNGHAGSILVSSRTNANIKGFLTHVRNKFAIMEEDIDHLDGYVYQVFMNQQDFEQQHKHPTRILGRANRTILVDDYWNNTRDNGFNAYFLPFSTVGFGWGP